MDNLKDSIIRELSGISRTSPHTLCQKIYDTYDKKRVREIIKTLGALVHAGSVGNKDGFYFLMKGGDSNG